jgi:hypothetical protein
LSVQLDRLLAGLAPAFVSKEAFARARTQWLAGLLHLGRHTVTGALSTAGQQHEDWSAAYRALQRLPTEQVFSSIQQHTLERTTGPWVVALDDSCTRKSGRRIPGCGWRRDPLSPPFHVNFTWGQRVLQFSAALPAADGSARLVPIDWVEAPLPQKPRRSAAEAAWVAYREARRQANVNQVAAARMAQLRGATNRKIHFVGDGRFTNRTVLSQLPTDTVLIGRTRKDTQLYAWCAPLRRNGRPRRYGTALPTPEQWRTDETVPWTEVAAWASDRSHTLRVKHLGPVMARIGGTATAVQVVVIAPTPYRLRKGGKLLYRQPAYLLCTDPDLPVATIVQEYLWRWDIEVNFRDEKTLLGVSEAQVRQPEAVRRQPASVVGAYALLLLAALDTYGHHRLPPSVPLPKWRRHAPPTRPTTALLLSQLRVELWSRCLRPESLTHFITRPCLDQNRNKPSLDLASAVFGAHR